MELCRIYNLCNTDYRCMLLQTYTLYNSVNENTPSAWNVSSNIGVQKDRNGNYKNFTIAYFVFEKVSPCGLYPPNEIVTFYDIEVCLLEVFMSDVLCAS